MDIFDAVADASIAQDEPWRELASCREVPPVLFFADDKDHEKLELAKSFCATCPVIDDCYNYWASLPADERKYGVWFGTTAKERRRADRARRLARAAANSA